MKIPFKSRSGLDILVANKAQLLFQSILSHLAFLLFSYAIYTIYVKKFFDQKGPVLISKHSLFMPNVPLRI
jgi:hypothetical protein